LFSYLVNRTVEDGPKSSFLRGPTPMTQPRRRRRWNCCIDDVAVSTFTRDGGGLPAPCIRWPGHDRSSHLPDDHGGPSTFVGVVGGKPVHACGNGGDRRLLEAGVAHLG